MKHALEPKRDKILIETEATLAETPSGLLMTEESKKRPHKAKVLKIGPDVNDVTIGEMIVFAKYAGTTVTFGENTPDAEVFLLIKEEDVIASYTEIKEPSE